MDASLDWCAPEACSLSRADQPARVAEWDVLFADAVCAVRALPAGVRFVLDRSATSPAVVADLADRESQCCSFLTFSLTVAVGTLALEVVSDGEHGSVVAALAERAQVLSGRP